MPLFHRLTRFRELSLTDRQFLFTAAMVWLPWTWIRLKLIGLGRLQRHLNRAPGALYRTAAITEVERLATLLRVACGWTFVPSTCLIRSLSLVRALQSRGIQTELRIGVRLESGKLDAHAWVEYQGVPVNDRHDIGARFAAFAQPLPSHAFRNS
jgi:hypothetical protein